MNGSDDLWQSISQESTRSGEKVNELETEQKYQRLAFGKG
jgi:hypothetical protein